MPRDEYYLPSRRLVSQDDAAIIERANVPRSKFSGSWTRKTTFDAGYLVPFMLDQIYPGDHMSYNVTAYVRLSTPLFPLFDNQRIDTFFFYVPNRLVMDEWAQFMGEQLDVDDTIDIELPFVTSPAGGYPVGSIFDYFNLPVEGSSVPPAATIKHSSLPLRAYNLIFNQWFRDENIVNSLAVPRSSGGGGDATTNYTLQRRAKAHDYFTSALPWPQKFTAPTIPLGGLAPIIGIGASNRQSGIGGPQDVFETGDTVSMSYPFTKNLFGDGTSADERMFARVNPDDGGLAIFADLAATSGVAINTLRQAWLVQSLLERDARGGTRYVELIRSHFGVTNPDFRLQRPEYIGGGQSTLQLTPVAQTAPSTGVPVGALGAAGTAVGSHRASYAATEHGWIIGIINVRSELSYQQGLHKMWTQLTRYDFYWPSLSGLGEQAILQKEIFVTGDPAQDELVFGYQERWHELRTRTSEVTGLMRSGIAETLDAWHLAQFFADAPTLSPEFIADTPPMARVLAAGDLAVNQQYLADIMIERSATRAVSTYGTPVTLGRF